MVTASVQSTRRGRTYAQAVSGSTRSNNDKPAPPQATDDRITKLVAAQNETNQLLKKLLVFHAKIRDENRQLSQTVESLEHAVAASTCMVKLIVIGDSGVGKSCLIYRFVRNEWRSRVVPSLNVDFMQKVIKLEPEGKHVTVGVWDTAGQEKFRSIARSYYRQAMGVILMYDVTRKETFRNIPIWFNEVTTLAPENTKTILVGCKSDDTEHRKVTEEEGRELSEELGIPSFAEVSARTNQGVQEAFDILVREIIYATEAGAPAGVIDKNLADVKVTGDTNPYAKGRCC